STADLDSASEERAIIVGRFLREIFEIYPGQVFAVVQTVNQEWLRGADYARKAWLAFFLLGQCYSSHADPAARFQRREGIFLSRQDIKFYHQLRRRRADGY